MNACGSSVISHRVRQSIAHRPVKSVSLTVEMASMPLKGRMAMAAATSRTAHSGTRFCRKPQHHANMADRQRS